MCVRQQLFVFCISGFIKKVFKKMEDHWQWSFVIPYILIAVIIHLLYKLATPWGRWESLGIPGPKPSMFVGNISQLFAKKTGMREKLSEWQNQYGRVFGFYQFRHPVLMVSDIDVIKQICIKDANMFADRWILGRDTFQPVINRGLFFANGEGWRRTRKIMTPIFTMSKLKLLVHHMNIVGENLTEQLRLHAKSGEPVKAKDVYGAYSIDVIFRAAFGLDINSQVEIEGPWFQHTKSLMSVPPFTMIVLFLKGVFPFLRYLIMLFDFTFFSRRDVNFINENISKIISDRREHPETDHADFLQFLMNSEAEESESDLGGSKKLTTEEILGQCVIFVIAGYETTSTTLQFMMYELSKRPEIEQLILDEICEVLADDKEPTYNDCQNMKYTEAVICETLRHYPPLHIISRESCVETTIGKYRIPANQAIQIPLGNVMMDSKYFPEPHLFNPERFISDENQRMSLSMFLPFGMGIRQCIGMRLAMLEMKIAIVHTLRAVRLTDVTPKTLEIMDYASLLVPVEQIKLFVEKR